MPLIKKIKSSNDFLSGKDPLPQNKNHVYDTRYKK